MIMQYDDLVLQTIDRLLKVIPQNPHKVADIIPMENYQVQLDKFFNGKETAKLMVTWSGNGAEGGREMKDFNKGLGKITEEVSHTIEVHICCKTFMLSDLTDNLEKKKTMLRLAWAVTLGLMGLKFYQRDNNGVVLIDRNYAQTEGMLFIETLIDRSYKGMPVAVMRFQVKEIYPQVENLEPENIWGQFKEITLQEYSKANGTATNISGEPTETVVVT